MTDLGAVAPCSATVASSGHEGGVLGWGPVPREPRVVASPSVGFLVVTVADSSWDSFRDLSIGRYSRRPGVAGSFDEPTRL